MSCESEKETLLEVSDLEIVGESSEVKDSTSKDIKDEITVEKKCSDGSSLTECEENYS